MSQWKTKKSLLIVGEGYNEEAFLNHVKQLYVGRGCGLLVTIKNARGKTPQHIIEWTLRQMAIAEYHKVAVMLDNDTEWTPKTIRLAKQRKIVLLKSDPCFEAVMLRLLKKSICGDTKSLKKQFAPYVNNLPSDMSQYSTHFDKNCLSNNNEEPIQLMLEIIEAMISEYSNS